MFIHAELRIIEICETSVRLWKRGYMRTRYHIKTSLHLNYHYKITNIHIYRLISPALRRAARTPPSFVIK